MKTKELEKNIDFFAAWLLTDEEMAAVKGGTAHGAEPIPVPPPPPIKY